MSRIKDGVIQFFRLKNVCLTVPKLFVGDPSVLCSRKYLVSKIYRKEGGGQYQDFPSKTFLSHSAENFRRGTL